LEIWKFGNGATYVRVQTCRLSGDVRHRGGLAAEAGDLEGVSSSVCQSRRCPWRRGGRCPLALGNVGRVGRTGWEDWKDLEGQEGFGLMAVRNKFGDHFQISSCIFVFGQRPVVNRRTPQTDDGDKQDLSSAPA
jgi:hypothetical protein